MDKILIYIVSALFMTGLLLVYFRLARKFGIVDNPNQRSSHHVSTIRGGGILFPVAALLWFAGFGFQQPWFIVGLILMAFISFMDDVMPLSSLVRMGIHVVAVSLLFWQLQIFQLPWPYIFVAYLLTIGWINAFNFMDGINGITPFYSLVTLGTLLWLNQKVVFISVELIILIIIAVLIFSFFNVRKKAAVFAGDIGSISMAFILAFLIISLWYQTKIVVYILFFSVYGVDTVFTLLYRLEKRQNIFQPHRSHLYQLLSNELKWPQLLVAGLFAGVQLIINIITIFLLEDGMMTRPVFYLILGVLAAVYSISRFLVNTQIAAQDGRS